MAVVALLTSALIAALLAPALLRALPTRPNWLGRALPFPAGLVAAVASILALGLLAAAQAVLDEPLVSEAPNFLVLFGALDGLPDGIFPLAATLAGLATLLLGVALLGLADDLLAGPSRGWRGHARAALRGEVSTGALKALGTAALAAAVLAGGPNWLLSVVLVALTTNLFNILDLRPGRAIKVFAVLAAALAAAGEWRRELGVFAGPLLVVGAYDLRVRAMLGDTGSNLIGALAGLWLVLALGATGEWIALGAVALVTLYGELRSITRTIEAVPPLRWLDELGRPSGSKG